MLEVMDTYAGAWNIMCIAMCECISICYVYGKYSPTCIHGNTIIVNVSVLRNRVILYLRVKRVSL